MDKKILVACPNYSGKEYAMDRWIAAVKSLTYPNITILQIDNSDNLDFYNKYKDSIPMDHLNLDNEGPNRRIALSMEEIRRQFLEGDFDYWFNVEADVIVPPDTIETMFFYGRDAEWISHYYPARGGDDLQTMSGFGCSLFSRKVILENDFSDAPEYTTTDGWWWHTKIMPHKYPVVELWSILDIKHLDQ